MTFTPSTSIMSEEPSKFFWHSDMCHVVLVPNLVGKRSNCFHLFTSCLTFLAVLWQHVEVHTQASQINNTCYSNLWAMAPSRPTSIITDCNVVDVMCKSLIQLLVFMAHCPHSQLKNVLLYFWRQSIHCITVVGKCFLVKAGMFRASHSSLIFLAPNPHMMLAPTDLLLISKQLAFLLMCSSCQLPRGS